MLGKLMKYEFKATGRIFLPLFGALLVAAAFNRLFIALDFTIPKIIGTTVSGSLMVAVFVVTLILTIQRFSKNLLSREGYLMFTLPVTTDSLVWSKLIVATIWTIVSFIAVMIAVAVMAVNGEDFTNWMEGLRSLFLSLQHAGVSGILIGIECVILGIGVLFTGILMLYTCIALSLFVNKHRVGFAFLMYIAISILGQTILGITAVSVNFDGFIALMHNMSGFGQIQTAFGFCLLFELIAGGIFYIVTRLMLKYKLNLE